MMAIFIRRMCVVDVCIDQGDGAGVYKVVVGDVRNSSYRHYSFGVSGRLVALLHPLPTEVDILLLLSSSAQSFLPGTLISLASKNYAMLSDGFVPFR